MIHESLLMRYNYHKVLEICIVCKFNERTDVSTITRFIADTDIHQTYMITSSNYAGISATHSVPRQARRGNPNLRENRLIGQLLSII